MSAEMTLEEIEALSAGCTPSPWVIRDDGQSYMMPIIDSPTVGKGYFASIGQATQRDPNPVHGGGISIQTATANGHLMASAPRLLEIAQEQAAEIARLKQYTCEACADADSCDRVGRAANRQCAAFRVVTKK